MLEKLEGDITELNYKIEYRDVHISTLNTVINAHLKSIGKLEERLKDEKVAREKVNKDYEIITAKQVKLQEDFNSKHTAVELLLKQYNQKVAEGKVCIYQLFLIKAISFWLF